MPDSMMEKTCTGFAESLAAKSSVPGGGGAAAYTAALGVALGEMVGNFTTGKQTYADVEPDVQRMLADGAAIRSRLLSLIDEDAAAFEPLSRAYSISKEDPARASVLEEATRNAITPPLEMMRQAAAAVVLLEEMAQKGSRMLVSDAGCGAALCSAALKAAAMNVFVNTRSLMDREFAANVEAEADELLSYVARADAVAESVMANLRG